MKYIPNHPLILLLAYVRRHLAFYLARAKGHCQSLCHILLDRLGDVGILAGRSNPDICRSLVFELALAKLCKLSTRNE